MTSDFWNRAVKTETCWLWQGKPNNSGYGSIVFNGRKTGAHRAAYEIANGPFDRALFVLHRCDTPLCVNPKHLFLGTQTDNMQDCAKKGRLKKAYRWTKENNPNKGKRLPKHVGEAVRAAKQRPYRIRAPSGDIIEGVNLRKFCRENNLNNGAMFSIIHGRIRYHKGYTSADA